VWRAAAIPLAAAAVLLVVSVFNRGPAWQLVSATGEGIAVVDGRPVAMSNAAELARLLRPGVRVRMPEGCEAELVSREQLAIQITGGSDVTIPDVPGRFWSRDVRSEVGSGEIRVTSGDAFRGARLSVITPEARVEMTGTTLAVIREPAGTCVCVLEGRVKVGPRDGELLGVDAGMRRFIFNDERSPELAPMRDAERTKLGMFRDARRESMTN
jgi:hypothetical protein